ncbi:antitoxin ParD1/3/4 [Methylobacterium phyllostachyos]|uniref:Antitoxin ParD1/3/4 n=1 Tax=Methylobacterium phyllostachyos TaxID=582672 RepID=A0A1H0KW64_9HYPH|nr:type II toxin-antitoxin system ParD family antitoxin [Methylobacterium phyllostachyos]SDO60026.1 antitoxin ParD1/3/4 [Methylobacterium phyllostachyos]
MAVRRTITVSITPEQEDLIQACLQSGRFASTSEVVRAALRLLDREESRPNPERPKLRGDGEAARA